MCARGDCWSFGVLGGAPFFPTCPLGEGTPTSSRGVCPAWQVGRPAALGSWPCDPAGLGRDCGAAPGQEAESGCAAAEKKQKRQKQKQSLSRSPAAGRRAGAPLHRHPKSRSALARRGGESPRDTHLDLGRTRDLDSNAQPRSERSLPNMGLAQAHPRGCKQKDQGAPHLVGDRLSPPSPFWGAGRAV